MRIKHIAAVLAAIIALLLGIAPLPGWINGTAPAAFTAKNAALAAAVREGRAAGPALVMPDKPADKPAELWRITAYCGCAKCCGGYAADRPEGKAYGAAGVELVQGISCAAPLPFGTVVNINGVGGFVVQDRTSSAYAERHGGRVIDLYFADHAAALAFGVKYLTVEV